jgi:hypothetical protein
MVKPFTLSKRAQRAMELAANRGRAAAPEPVYAYGVPPAIAARFDATRFDVRTLVVRRDHKPLTVADLEVIEADLAAAWSRAKTKRKATTKRAATRAARMSPTRAPSR